MSPVLMWLVESRSFFHQLMPLWEQVSKELSSSLASWETSWFAVLSAEVDQCTQPQIAIWWLHSALGFFEITLLQEMVFHFFIQGELGSCWHYNFGSFSSSGDLELPHFRTSMGLGSSWLHTDDLLAISWHRRIRSGIERLFKL